MKRAQIPVILAVAVALAALVLWPAGPVGSQSISEVIVTNFPHPQLIRGEVTIEDPVRLAKMVSFGEITVPPVRRTDSTRLLEAGTLVTDGFPNVVLSLHGQVKGSVQRRGDVGAILLPERESIQQAFNELGLMHFALEVVASGVSSETPYFASTQPRYTVGFTSYRILLYNSTDKTVTTELYAYLTN